MVRVQLRIAENLLLANEPDLNDKKFLTKYESIQKNFKKIEDHLEAVYFLLRKDFFVNSNIKAMNEYLKAKLNLHKGISIFFKKQSEIIQKHFEEKKSKTVSKIIKNLPIDDIARNKYILKVPTFSKFLREKFIPVIEESKELYTRAMNFLKGENILQEFNFTQGEQ